MEEFILGYPKNQKPVFSNITRFTVMQDAGNACHDFVGITANNLEEAKDKFIELAIKNFEPCR